MYKYVEEEKEVVPLKRLNYYHVDIFSTSFISCSFLGLSVTVRLVPT